jgi:hypothetical protein
MPRRAAHKLGNRKLVNARATFSEEIFSAGTNRESSFTFTTEELKANAHLPKSLIMKASTLCFLHTSYAPDPWKLGKPISFPLASLEASSRAVRVYFHLLSCA